MFFNDYQTPEAIINDLPGLFFIKDKDSQYVAANKRFKQFCEFTDGKGLIGLDDYEMSWADRANIYREADRQVMSGKSLAFLEPLLLRDNMEILVVSRKSPFYNMNQEVTGITCNIT